MADINHVVLIGRLTRDAELRATTNGTMVSKFSIAVNRRRKNGDQWEDEANFFDIVLWGRQAESLQQYLVKGKQVGITGELRQDRWQQDGQNRSKVEVVANTLQLFGGGSSNGEGRDNSGGYNSGNRDNGNYGNGGQNNARQNQSRGNPPSSTYSDRKNDDDDSFTDDIPF